MKVSGLPKDPGPAAWNEILSRRTGYPPLEESKTSDWLIIGAGFAGLSAARRLRQLHPQDSITILEARCIAEGPAGRNSGFMIDLPHNLASKDYASGVEEDLRQIKMNRAAINFASAAAEEYGLSEEAFVRSGKTNSAASAAGVKHNLNYAKHLSLLDEPHEMLDARQMQDLTGSSYYQNGLYTPGTALIQPALFVRGIADGLKQAHVEIFENSPVIDLSQDGQKNWTAKSSKGSICAGNVILAINGHVESFGFYKHHLMHVFLYASMTKALSKEEIKRLGGQERWGCTPSDPMGTTVRKLSGTGGDRIVVRNRFTYAPNRSVKEDKIDNIAKVHDRSFAARFPQLKDIAMDYRWGGLLCLSRNSAPAFGELEEGLWSACCQNGLGTAKGTLSGMLAAELACGHHSWQLDQMLLEGSPQRLPPEPFSSIGINSYMRWREFKAGREL